MGQTIRSVEDWSDLKALNPFSGFTGKIVAAAARLRSRLPSHIPVIATVFNPVFQASQLRGFDALRDDMLQAPQLVRTALDHLSNDTERTIQALRDAGVDGIFSQLSKRRKLLWTKYCGSP
ncbi:MAG: hypothetical protein HWD60_01785 [Defluviicoccus sp.]|nr:MAG: hypothetical protein HWD60_01785 [Defluviicoccus sp.]